MRLDQYSPRNGPAADAAGRDTSVETIPPRSQNDAPVGELVTLDLPRFPNSGMNEELVHSEITGSIVGAFYDVYNYYGYGLLEAVYVAGLMQELRDRGHHVRREARFPVIYKGRCVGIHRVDLLVDGKIIVECKATEALPPYAERQVLSYLNATAMEVGLILHFGPEPRFHRYVDTLKNRRRGPYKRS